MIILCILYNIYVNRIYKYISMWQCSQYMMHPLRRLNPTCLQPKIVQGSFSQSHNASSRRDEGSFEWHYCSSLALKILPIINFSHLIFHDVPCDPSCRVCDYRWVNSHSQETKESLGEAAQDLADLWATRADILMNLGGLKRASNVLWTQLRMISLIFPKFAAEVTMITVSMIQI